MKDNEFYDAEEIYQNRGSVHKTDYADKQGFTDMRALSLQAKALKKAGKEEDEIAHELNISSADIVREILKG